MEAKTRTPRYQHCTLFVPWTQAGAHNHAQSSDERSLREPADAARALRAEPRQQRLGAHAEHRVRPARRDLQQGDEDERTFVQQGMGEDEPAALCASAPAN